MKKTATVKVWDPLVRIFHWALVAAFTIAFISGEDFLTLHSWAGYLILGLLMVRIFWGFIGTKYARFCDFIYRPKTIIQFLKDTAIFKAKRYLGHNPAGGAMVILLMISLLITSFTGLVVYGAEDHAGPLAHWFTGTQSAWGEAAEELHEFFANFTLLLVLFHVLGVIVESLIHKENLVSAMITGFKPAKNTVESTGDMYENTLCTDNSICLSIYKYCTGRFPSRHQTVKRVRCPRCKQP
ncbi:MAG: cytochrome b/b6 domain-containing protein [Gammaproteobacteria bacterium]|nr:MAG: cytochrome b/b6 domain-containing protein [Gammaproteobacteria bacterium]